MLKVIVMKRVKIDMQDLIDAFENCSLEHSYFFDTEKEKIYEEIDSHPERFIAIPEQEPREGYNETVYFANTVTDENLKEKLDIALDGRGAFRRF